MSEERNQQVQPQTGLSRRKLLKGASLSLGMAAAASVTAVAAPATAPARKQPEAAVTTELPFDPVPAPAITEYRTDIMVIGAGFAGIPAAIAAQQAGKQVLIVDKGHPGYSGCSPFPQSYQFFSEELGDDRAAHIKVTRQAGEYLANLDWYKVYLDESKGCYDQAVAWGIIKPFPKASVAGDYFEKNKEWEYHRDFASFDRRARWNDLLEEKKIPSVNHTMVLEVVKNSAGRVIGALGLHVPSGTLITFHARAVIVCAGGGSFRSAGWPTSGDTFDNEWIGYQAGAAIAGKEFSYIMGTNSIAPASSWRNYSWGYLENLHPTGGVYNASDADEYIKTRLEHSVLGQLNNMREGVAPIDASKRQKPTPDNAKHAISKNDPRLAGNDSDAMPARDIGGAAVGKGVHKCDGIFCGIDDLVGDTGIPGLYAAGDAMASMIYGCVYSPAQGGSIIVSQIQGRRAAQAAAKFIDSTSPEKIAAATIDARASELLAPLKRKKGFSPYWADDALLAIMSPYWVDFYKTEATLSHALDAVLELSRNVLPKLMARNSHELRLCHEVEHKLLSAEIKLRLSLERKESRGYCQRKDYPFRDDKNFLCYITARKAANGSMDIGRVPIKDEWKGDTSLPHEQRYVVLYPGEAEALGLKKKTT